MVSTRNRQIISLIKKNLIFFALSKGVAFLAPLLFVNYVSLEDYGLIEFSYSTGTVMAGVLMLGLGGAYPYFILKRQDEDKRQSFFLYGFLILLLFALFAPLFYGGQISDSVYFVFLFTAIFALQRLYSTILKSHDKGHLAVLYDGGYYFVLATVIIVAILFKATQPVLSLRIGMEFYLLALIILFICKFIESQTKNIKELICKDYPHILKYSVHLIISGFIIFWLTSNSKIYIKYLLGYEQVGIYSFYFRMAGISIIIHTFCYITFFKKLYLSNPAKLDKYYFILLSIVFICCVICYFIAPSLMKMLSINTITQTHNKLFLLLCFQMPIWVGIALNEGIVARENIVKYSNLYLGIFTAIFPVVLYFLRDIITLELFTIMSILLFGISYFTQMQLLKKRGVVFRKCQIFNVMSVIIAIIIYFI
ncbi:MAG: hypothetical protein RR397_09645 [Odoribacter sp.]